MAINFNSVVILFILIPLMSIGQNNSNIQQATSINEDGASLVDTSILDVQLKSKKVLEIESNDKVLNSFSQLHVLGIAQWPYSDDWDETDFNIEMIKDGVAMEITVDDGLPSGTSGGGRFIKMQAGNENEVVHEFLRKGASIKGHVTIGGGFSDNYIVLKHDWPGVVFSNQNTNNVNWKLYASDETGHFELYENQNYRGQFDATSGDYSSISDARLKTNIRPLGKVLSRVLQLEPSHYTFQKDQTQKDYIGFIAQDVAPHFPILAKETSVGDTEEKLYTMNYGTMSVVAIAAIQEQQELINELKKQNELILERLIAIEEKLEKK